MFLSPIALGLYILGYILMFILAATIAPRVARAVSGRFTLYGAMGLTAALIVFTTAFVIYLVATAANFVVTETYFLGLIFFVVLVNLLIYLASPYII
ncbi:MAG: protease, partial [Pyrobaculum sp.]